MSDPAPKPCETCPAALEPAELISDGTCRNRRFYDLAILALVSLNLVATILFGVLGLVDDDEPKPDPKPSPTSSPTPGTPEPSSPPTGGSGGPTGEPTSPGEPTPSDPGGSGGGCSIFDPECGSTSGGEGG